MAKEPGADDLCNSIKRFWKEQENGNWTAGRRAFRIVAVVGFCISQY